MFLDRILSLESDLARRSVFLFGPRQTGKTTLLRRSYPDAHWFNLLKGEEFLRLSAEPWRLREEVAHLKPGSVVVVDEIQRLPSLLNEIHTLIEEQELRFVLTGSSPVKLRRGGVNLLGGRARTRYLSPLVYPEFHSWDLDRIVAVGSLPSIYLSDEPWEDLRSYVGTYLQQEVQAEGLVRGIESFSRFLRVAALGAGEQTIFERIASDAQVPARTIREYYGVLQETLLGRLVQPHRPSRVDSRKPVSRGKFYFFDAGVVQALVGRRSVAPGTEEYGRAVEQYIFTELEAWTRYNRIDREIAWWRTTGGLEVDFVVPDRYAIEVKGGGSVGRGDLKGLQALRNDDPSLTPILVCTESRPRVVDGIDILPVRDFLIRLWGEG
ncbi:MAG: ATP-binding protein [Spirochaetaceae bacterium]|nr:MAG: ATP-binding protein [Spirochaetaceae bacterium]